LSPKPNLRLLYNVLQEYKEALGKKFLLAKLLLRIQQTCEEREILLHYYLSQEDIERVTSENNPLEKSDNATIGAKYLHAVCNQSLGSFIANDHVVS
jgi:hypothetical protein